MNKLMHKALLRFAIFINIALLACPFVYSWFLYYADRIKTPYYMRGNWLVIALFVILYIAFSHTYDAFLISYNRISEMVYSQGLALVISDMVMYIVVSLLSMELANIWPFVIVFMVQILFSVLWSVTTQRWYFATYKPKKTAIIYDVRQGMESLINEYGLDKKFEIVAMSSAAECIEEKMKMLEGIETVFVCGVHSRDRNIILKYCIANDIRLFVIPRVGDVIMSSAKKMHMFHLPMLMLERYNPSAEYLFLKRAFDIVCSGLALIVASPFMLITAIAIKVCDGGPVLYKQCRMTKDGKLFDVLKFRSMRVDAEKNGAQLSTGDKDDRVTPVGRFIRKVRIDELPQLINILRGDMSVVGPRPERPEIAEQYLEELPEFHLRLQAKAGLTGYAQVYGKYNTTPYDKLLMDLMYIANPSFVEDMKIVLATIKILFLPESTEGIAEGQTTAMGVSKMDVQEKREMDVKVEYAATKEKKSFFEKLSHNKGMQVLFFVVSMLVLLIGHMLLSTWLKQDIIKSKSVVFDSQIAAQIEDVHVDEDNFTVEGWALRLDANITDIKVVLESVDKSQEYIFNTTFDGKYISEKHLEYFRLDKSESKGFRAKCDGDKINSDICYEVLLYITYMLESDVQAGMREMRKISTSQYLYAGKLYDYNPLEFKTPEFQDVLMDKVVEQGVLCAYDMENGVWIYLHEGNLYWILDKNIAKNQDEHIEMFFHLVTSKTELLPEYRQTDAFDYKDFVFEKEEIDIGDSVYRVAQVPLSVEYPIMYMITGHYENGNRLWVLQFEMPLY